MNHDERVVFDQSLNKMEKALYTEGYREGLASGKELKFQQGFDMGFSVGFKAGYTLGRHNGILRCLKSNSSELENSTKDQLSVVEEIDKTSRGLCVICSKESEDKSTKSDEYSQEALSLSIIKEYQDKVIREKISRVITEDYSSVLCSFGLDGAIKK